MFKGDIELKSPDSSRKFFLNYGWNWRFFIYSFIGLPHFFYGRYLIGVINTIFCTIYYINTINLIINKTRLSLIYFARLDLFVVFFIAFLNGVGAWQFVVKKYVKRGWKVKGMGYDFFDKYFQNEKYIVDTDGYSSLDLTYMKPDSNLFFETFQFIATAALVLLSHSLIMKNPLITAHGVIILFLFSSAITGFCYVIYLIKKRKNKNGETDS